MGGYGEVLTFFAETRFQEQQFVGIRAGFYRLPPKISRNVIEKRS